MAQVTIKNLKKTFGKVLAVKDFNLEIKDGEFVVLVGPSGCGKTTALRLVAGLEDIEEGEIYIGDRLVNDLDPKDRNVAMVFQNYALYPHMNVYRNMAFGLKLRKVPRNEIEERVKKAAKILGIEQLLDRKPKQLSGGQMQRVAVGRAIVRDPHVFLFDEPLSNLDAKLRTQMRSELAKLHQELGATMIYVTHDQVEAMTMGDRIVVMKDGLIQQVGNPLELYENPKNLFVAGFIGSPAMNFFEGILTKEDSELVFKRDSLFLKIPTLKNDKIHEWMDRTIVLGIRPDDIRLAVAATEKVNAIQTKAEVVEPLGSETLITATVEKTLFLAKIIGVVRIKFGETVSLHFDTSRVHLFDTESGKCLTNE
jgi:multiple sugar transport system ATP-binding protein